MINKNILSRIISATPNPQKIYVFLMIIWMSGIISIFQFGSALDSIIQILIIVSSTLLVLIILWFYTKGTLPHKSKISNKKFFLLIGNVDKNDFFLKLSAFLPLELPDEIDLIIKTPNNENDLQRIIDAILMDSFSAGIIVPTSFKNKDFDFANFIIKFNKPVVIADISKNQFTNRVILDKSNNYYHILFDNKIGGYIAAKFAKRLLAPKPNIKSPTKNILIITDDTQIERETSFVELFGDQKNIKYNFYNKIEINKFDIDENIRMSIKTQLPSEKIDLIFCTNDQLTEQCSHIMIENKIDSLLIGYDATDTIRKEINMNHRNGKKSGLYNAVEQNVLELSKEISSIIIEFISDNNQISKSNSKEKRIPPKLFIG